MQVNQEESSLLLNVCLNLLHSWQYTSREKINKIYDPAAGGCHNSDKGENAVFNRV